MQKSTMPADTSDLSGHHEILQLRQENFTQNPSDVYAVRWSGGGGFGDPFERDLEDIATDLDTFAITPEAAKNIYGAIILSDGTIDAEASILERKKVKQNTRKQVVPIMVFGGNWPKCRVQTTIC